MLRLLTELSVKNNFTLIRSDSNAHNHSLFRDYIFEAIRNERPTVIAQHFYFPEVTYGSSVAYMNMMRAPVARLTSFYYFRLSNLLKDHPDSNHANAYGNMTIDECISLPDIERNRCFPFVANEQAMYMCGRERSCEGIEPSELYARAWRNVLLHYPAVGLTEHMYASLQLFEVMFPSFFNGVTAVYNGTALVTDNQAKLRLASQAAAIQHYQIANSSSAAVLESYYSDVDMRLFSSVQTRFHKTHAECIARI